MSGIATVEAFIAAWNALDYDAIYAALAEDVVWDNVPMAIDHGKAAVRARLDAFAIKGCDWHIRAIAEAGGRVLTERLDRFLLESGNWAELPVMGIFEFDGDGRISLWRDYFDMEQFRKEFAK